MRHSVKALVGILLIAQFAWAQSADTSKILSEVTIQSYLYNRPLAEVPAAIGRLDARDLERFNNTSFLPAVNTVPGVRMEERSPGSYRFSIRGSLIRSPFGVRNVKVYWNRLPLTDGGGNTYLNLVDLSAISQFEIIKGPGGSLYGAGTGGVVLISKNPATETAVEASTVMGSYGLRRYQISADLFTNNVNGSVNLSTQQADGFREHTRMNRTTMNADLQFIVNPKSNISTTFFYTDLFYQTPGALTKAEYDADPRQARPTVGMAVGAIDQNAFVENKAFYGGVSYDVDWNERWSTRTGFFYSKADFENFAIRNVEHRDETNLGVRTETQYAFAMDRWKGKISFGGEFQHFTSPIDIFVNSRGAKGALTLGDDLTSEQWLLFGQTEFDLAADVFITLGASANFLKYKFEREFPERIDHDRNFTPVVLPRLAILKKINSGFSIYGSVSSGFSPPSLAEVRPSTNTYNENLQAEKGLSVDLGIRGTLLKQIAFDITAYQFQLDETIVIQRTADGADFFINAGETSQRGLEAMITWNAALPKTGFINRLKVSSSQSYNYFRFKDYIKDNLNFSGNKLTGVPPTTSIIILDVGSFSGLYTNLTASYVDHVPLNDANSEYAKEYFLLNVRLGYQKKIGSKLMLDVFVGADNALNQTYSLGNDLNAIGRRYYNAAAGRNYFAGIKIRSVFNSLH